MPTTPFPAGNTATLTHDPAARRRATWSAVRVHRTGAETWTLAGYDPAVPEFKAYMPAPGAPNAAVVGQCRPDGNTGTYGIAQHHTRSIRRFDGYWYHVGENDG